jgi:hypothetical protein
MAQSGPDSGSVERADETPAADAGDDDREWEFALDDVGPDGIVEAEPEPIEPGTPRLENVVFVLLGVVGTLFLLSTVI